MPTVITTENPNYPVGHILSTEKPTLSSNIDEQVDFLEQQTSYIQRQIGLRIFEKVCSLQPDQDFWHNTPGYVKQFVEMSVESPEKVKKQLIQWTDRYSALDKPKPFDVLNKLRVGPLARIKKIEKIAVIKVLVDTVDEVSERIGEMPENLYVMFYAADWVAHEALRWLSIEERIELVTDALKHGKACTWLFSSVLHLMYEHRETTRENVNPKFWLIKDEIEIFKKITFDRIQIELNKDFYALHKPVFMFLFWNEVGTQQQTTELRSWIKNHIIDDENIIKFVSMFTGTVLTGTGTYWRVLTGSLSEFISIDEVRTRLEKLADKSETLASEAIRLISGIDTMNTIAGDRAYKKFIPY